MSSAILTWHSLDESGSVISTPPSIFKRQMESLAQSGVKVVPLSEVRDTPESVALTFDDGFSNLAEHAFPLLERFQWPATVFIVSQHCGLSNRWSGRTAAGIPDLPLLSWEQLAGLPPRVAIGAHTATHPHLTQISAEECDRELRQCRDAIEQRLSVPVKSLAYPYGDSSGAIHATARRYFNLAVGTSLRFLSRASNPLDLPRIDMYYFRGGFPVGRLFDPPGRMYVGFRNILREVRAHLPG